MISKVATLEAENAQLHFKVSQSCEEKSRAHALKAQAVEEGGLEHSRTLASLEESVEQDIVSKPPKAIYEEAIFAFNSKDFEKAAKTLSLLADNKENKAYQTVRIMYLSGVSFYNVANYKRALQYFNRAVQIATNESVAPDEISYAPRAQSWVALCWQKIGNETERKKAVFELVQKYPKSKEARRLNQNAM